MIMMILIWFLGLFVVFDLLTVWFKSGLPAHVFRVLWKMDRGKDKRDWPPSISDPYLWNREEWEVWINTVSPFWGELLTCPVCLSKHMSWIVALILILVLGTSIWPAAVAGVFTWTGLSNRILT